MSQVFQVPKTPSHVFSREANPKIYKPSLRYVGNVSMFPTLDIIQLLDTRVDVRTPFGRLIVVPNKPDILQIKQHQQQPPWVRDNNPYYRSGVRIEVLCNIAHTATKQIPISTTTSPADAPGVRQTTMGNDMALVNENFTFFDYMWLPLEAVLYCVYPSDLKDDVPGAEYVRDRVEGILRTETQLIENHRGVTQTRDCGIRPLLFHDGFIRM